MDMGMVVGFILGIIFLIVGISLGGSLLMFVDLPSIMIVVGCTFATFLMANPLSLCIGAIKITMKSLVAYDPKPLDTISIFVSFAEKARRDGLLALESDIDELKDPFLKKGLQLVVDGTDPNLIKGILETELAGMEARHATAIGVYINIATLAPAFGMIGTLIGLINMLAKMDDPSAIGPSMSVALITTMYGSFVANFLANPVAFKLRSNSGNEVGLRELMIEGMLAIQSGDNPRIVEERLKAFLAPSARGAAKKEEGE
ncbi:MAG: motility protein A [bacterium]|nr:motility protein A [bacterium]